MGGKNCPTETHISPENLLFSQCLFCTHNECTNGFSSLEKESLSFVLYNSHGFKNKLSLTTFLDRTTLLPPSSSKAAAPLAEARTAGLGTECSQ